MESLLLALALFAVPPAPSTAPGCYCRVCDCTNCDCTGVCACPTCKSRLQVQPFGNSEELPVEIVLVTAEEWCPACQVLSPHWKAIDDSDPLCRTLDISDDEGDEAKEARKYGVRYLPTLVRLVNGRKERSMVVAGMNREQLRAVARRWKE